jgi:DNA polymerase-4
MRRIIHVDQDCFYAAVELRERPDLQGKPVGIAGSSRRSVLTTCNYEAREFGCRSGMPVFKALQACPTITLLPPRFEIYREISSRIRAILRSYTELVEPLSLDEAYLDVSEDSRPAYEIATEIRTRIQEETSLPSSAGIAPNKMLAKIASDWEKPDGQFEIKEDEVNEFVRELPVRKLWGVGPRTEDILKEMGVTTCADLQRIPQTELARRFGKFGLELRDLCRGKDERPVIPHRPPKSMSVERTFAEFVDNLETVSGKVHELYSELMDDLRAKNKLPKVVGIFAKLKFSDFTVTTVSKAGERPVMENYLSLVEEGFSRNDHPIRLIGLGVRLREESVTEAQLNFLEALGI